MKPHRFDVEHKAHLMNDDRKREQPAGGIVDRAGIISSDIVADLGCGNGYITLSLLKRSDKVIAVDAQKGMLTDLEGRAGPADRSHLHMVLAELPDIPMKDGAVDRVILINMLHELEDKELMVQECRRVLRKGGIATVVDFHKRPTSFGPPLEERIEEDEVLHYFKDFAVKGRFSTEVFYQFEFGKQ